jgi:protein-tyrosine-phosphatase
MKPNQSTTRVLIVCTGNICRSPMAQGLLKQMLPRQLKDCVCVESAGTNALESRPAESNAIRAAGSLDFDISGHRARRVTAKMISRADWVLVMEKVHARQLARYNRSDNDKIRCLQTFGPAAASLDIPDPYSGSLATYQECAHLIKECLTGFVAFLDKP